MNERATLPVSAPLSASSLHGRITWMFVALAAILMGLLGSYWIGVLEPRLRDEAEIGSRALAQAQAEILADALASDSPELFQRAIDRLLLLSDPKTDNPFVLGVELELDEDAFEDSETIPLLHGETLCGGCFLSEIPLYSPNTRELLGIARFYGSDHFYQELRGDVRGRMLGAGGVVLFLLLLGWWSVALMLRPLRALVAAIAEWSAESPRRLVDPPAFAGSEIFLLHRALTELLRKVEDHTGALHQLNEELEHRVEERTAELRDSQKELLRRERLVTLGQLTATVSHELRNPLGAMQPSLYLLRRMAPEEKKIHRAVERIERGVQRCDHIIDELLDFTRIGDLDLRRGPLDPWLEELLDELIVPAGITVRRELGLGEQEVSFDGDRLRRAIINVYENACQAMQPEEGAEKMGEGTLKVCTEAVEERYLIHFFDTGSGISPEDLTKIFEPLYSTRTFGVGLGCLRCGRFLNNTKGRSRSSRRSAAVPE